MKRAPTTIPRASKEVILEAKKLTNPAARFIVSNYYDYQDQRKRADMQLRHLGDGEADNLAKTLEWNAGAAAAMEADTAKQLKAFAETSVVGQWCMSHYGVGPVITAGLLAHLDITVAPTAGHFWSFAGLNPLQKWEKGQKRPYCAAMKQLMFHLGECFKRTSGVKDAFYSQFYKTRKDMLVQRNDAGEFAERAKVFFTKSADVKKTLATGKLPAGNLDRQACNQAAKMFLSHLHAVMYWNYYKEAPPKPFMIAIKGHAHEVKIPNLHFFPGLEEAYYPQQGGRKKPVKTEPVPESKKSPAKKKAVAKTPAKKTTRKRALEAAE